MGYIKNQKISKPNKNNTNQPQYHHTWTSLVLYFSPKTLQSFVVFQNLLQYWDISSHEHQSMNIDKAIHPGKNCLNINYLVGTETLSTT